MAGFDTLPMVWSPSTSGRTEHHGHPHCDSSSNSAIVDAAMLAVERPLPSRSPRRWLATWRVGGPRSHGCRTPPTDSPGSAGSVIWSCAGVVMWLCGALAGWPPAPAASTACRKIRPGSMRPPGRFTSREATDAEGLTRASRSPSCRGRRRGLRQSMVADCRLRWLDQPGPVQRAGRAGRQSPAWLPPAPVPTE
jgi:hypothetical protein